MEFYGLIRKDPGYYKMGTHDVKKTLGLRFVKEIQTFGGVIGPHSIVSFG